MKTPNKSVFKNLSGLSPLPLYTEKSENGVRKHHWTADGKTTIDFAIHGIRPSKFISILVMSKRIRERAKDISPGSGSDLNHILDVVSPEPQKRYIFGNQLLKIQVSVAIPT